MFNKNYYITFLAALIFVLSGCAKELTCKDQLQNEDLVRVGDDSISFYYEQDEYNGVFSDYFISAGDVLDVLFHIQTNFGGDEYHFELENDNKVIVKFTSAPELNEEQYIRPDGTISLPIIGEVKAAGKTIEELKEELEDKYVHILRNPEIHILVPEFSKRIEEMKRDLHTAPRGLSRLVTVRPDGYVTFPMVGEVKVVGRTIGDVNEELNINYAKIFRGLQIDLFLQESIGSNVYVLGNVNKVGAYKMTRPITILEALTLAEGTALGSDLEEVVVFRRYREENKVVTARVNINVDRELSLRCNTVPFLLKPDDLVYVPRTGVAETAEYSTYLREAIMFRGWTVNVSPFGNVLD